MKNFILTAILFCTTLSMAQTWSDDVAQITYDRCSQCHHSGGIAPFELMNYSQVVASATAIQEAIMHHEMPPNPPDENYESFVHSKALTATEEATYLAWITANTPEGNSANTPPPPVFQEGAVLGDGDLQVRMPVYTSKATSTEDDYACFSVPSGLLQDRIIKSVEIIPGNSGIVHHALIYIDPVKAEVTDSIGGDCSSPSNTTTKLISAYIPGGEPLVLPSSDPLKLGFSIPAESNIYFAMHYPDGSAGQQDSTMVIFHFYPEGETGVREVSAEPILQNWNFQLPPNEITAVNAQQTIPADYSVLSVLPHMHLLGKSIKSYSVSTTQDTTRFISIPHWDFHWQGFYFFKNLKHVTPGSTMYADGEFDNTHDNHDNPSDPPVLVFPGLNTKDEMFLVYFHYFAYETGDENYDLETLMNTASLKELNKQNSDVWTISPNPFNNSTSLTLKNSQKNDQVQVTVYNSMGRLVKKLKPLESQHQTFIWDGNLEDGSPVAKGMYYFSIGINGQFSHQAIIKQ